jgi:hypothetical protein
MNGVSGSAARNLNDWFGFEGDFGVYRGHVPESITGETYMAGPRVSFRKFDRVVPFAENLFLQALLGGSHFSQSTGGITGGGTQFALLLAAAWISRSAQQANLPYGPRSNTLASAQAAPSPPRLDSRSESHTAWASASFDRVVLDYTVPHATGRTKQQSGSLSLGNQRALPPLPR